jgi:sulfopyruvate decarboxylase alpha subunit
MSMDAAPTWPDQVFEVLKGFRVRQVAYVPDAGHARLIERAHDDARMRPIVLTTEEEGVALAGGAWLGGERSVLLLQSSGVGNCVNMLSLIGLCRFPFLALVTMRGEWGEFNPWQIPMGQATRAALELMGVQVMRAERPDEAAEVVQAAAVMAYEAEDAVAILLSQRLIGAKVFAK